MLMEILIDRRDPRTQPQGVEPGYDATALRWPSQPLHKRPLTASELSGPQDLLRRLAPLRGDLAGHGGKRAIGQLIHLRARVVAEDGAPGPGAWWRRAPSSPGPARCRTSSGATPAGGGRLTSIFPCGAACGCRGW